VRLHLLRAVAVTAASAVVLGTGVAWSQIRSFESGINHINSAALGGGGDDGAIDILLVGMDSRTDAHGKPTVGRTTWRRCGPATTCRPTPTPSS